MEKVLFGEGWYPLERDDTKPFVWSTGKSSLFVNDRSAKFLVLAFLVHPDTTKIVTVSQGVHSKDYVLNGQKCYVVFYLDRTSNKYPQEIVITTQTFIPSEIHPTETTDSRTLGQCLIALRVNEELVPLDTISIGDFLLDRKQFQPEFGLQSLDIDVWCLTLKSTPKREEYARKHLDDHNLKYRMFYGLDAKETGVSSDVIYQQKFTKIDDWVTVGQVGCYVSHYMLWQNILENSDDTILILEDDAQLEDDFIFRLNEALYHVPNDWGLLYLGYESLHGVQPRVINDRICEAFPACTYAYMIKKSTIPILLNEIKPINCPVDTMLRYKLKDKVKSYVLTPQLVYQKSSLLQGGNVDPTFKSMTYDWEMDIYRKKDV